MLLSERIRRARDLTPTERHLAQAILALGSQMQSYTVKELARTTSTSPASVNRLCKKLGLVGFKELKLEVMREHEASVDAAPTVDVNFPFAPGDSQHTIVSNMSALYATTIADTAKLLDPAQLKRATRFIAAAESVEIYTGSHNVYPAQMFEERLLSAGKRAVCPLNGERQTRYALASGPHNVAIIITYSGNSDMYRHVVALLHERRTPVVLVGSSRARRALPGADAYLMVSERESLQNRITQFASHIAVQYVLDTLFCCVFACDYGANMDFLRQSLPYTAILPTRRTSR